MHWPLGKLPHTYYYICRYEYTELSPPFVLVFHLISSTECPEYAVYEILILCTCIYLLCLSWDTLNKDQKGNKGKNNKK